MFTKEKKFLFEIEEIIVGISAIALVFSAFLPWGVAEGYSASGLGGDGKIIIGLGAIALTILMIDVFIREISAVVPLVLGVAACAIGIIDYAAMYNAVSDFAGQVGIGLHLVITASIGIVFGAIVDFVRNRKK
jgi:hypothetical protein